jgi:hypothetical protein
MSRFIEQIEPYFSILRVGFIIVLIGYAVLCLVDLTQRPRKHTLQFGTKQVLILTLIAAHACSVAAITRAAPRSSTTAVDFLLTIYIFGPLTILFALGCFEATKGRPYFLLIALLYVLTVKAAASLPA